MSTTTKTGISVSVNRLELLRALKPMRTIISKTRGSIPILSSLLLQVGDHDQLVISATDMETRLEVRVPVAPGSAGETALPASQLIAFVSMVTAEEIRISNLGEYAQITAGDDELRLWQFPVDKYPAIPDREQTPTFVIGRSDLMELANVCRITAGMDESKPWLTGIRLRTSLESGDLMAVSTTGIAIGAWAKPVQVQEVKAATVKPEPLLLAASLAVPGEEISVSFSDMHCLIQGHNFRVWGWILEGDYPNVLRLVPPEYPHQVIVERHALLSGIRLMAAIGKMGLKEKSLVLETTSSGLTISGGAEDVGFFARHLPGTVKGEPLKIGFNTEILRRPVDILPGPELLMEYSGSRNPVRLHCPDQPHISYVVLPLITF